MFVCIRNEKFPLNKVLQWNDSKCILYSYFHTYRKKIVLKKIFCFISNNSKRRKRTSYLEKQIEKIIRLGIFNNKRVDKVEQKYIMKVSFLKMKLWQKQIVLDIVRSMVVSVLVQRKTFTSMEYTIVAVSVSTIVVFKFTILSLVWISTQKNMIACYHSGKSGNNKAEDVVKKTWTQNYQCETPPNRKFVKTSYFCYWDSLIFLLRNE